MKVKLYLIVILLLVFGCSHEKNTGKNELEVFCAASLTDVMSEITTEFEKENHISVKLNLASSGTLARQIEYGANPALFISANKKWVDYIKKLKLTIPGSEKKVAGNSLVLVAPLKSKIDSFAFSPDMDLPELFKGRISMGDPLHVPAGSYAVQTLKSLGCEKEMESRFLPAKDVRSALMVVELGEVEAGIVYKTDALKSKKVKIITEFPDSLHQPVNYYMSLIKGQDNSNAEKLYHYITSGQAITIWKKYGFII